MAYVPGTYTRELIQQHKQGDHAYEPSDNCPTCRSIQKDEGPDAAHEAIMDIALNLEEATAGHASHRAGNSPDSCLICAAQANEEVDEGQ